MSFKTPYNKHFKTLTFRDFVIHTAPPGKTFNEMTSETNNDNINRQLRLSLRVTWEDEDGKPGKYPELFWYLKFFPFNTHM